MKTIGLGPEVEPEVKEIRASRLAAKVFLGMRPWYFSAVLVIGWPFSKKPSRAWNSISSSCSSSGPASSTVRPSRLIICLTDLASCFKSLIRLSVAL